MKNTTPGRAVIGGDPSKATSSRPKRARRVDPELELRPGEVVLHMGNDARRAIEAARQLRQGRIRLKGTGKPGRPAEVTEDAVQRATRRIVGRNEKPDDRRIADELGTDESAVGKWRRASKRRKN